MVKPMSKVLWLIVAVVFSTTAMVAGQHVPCYYIFGDATVDNGNNNNLNTREKVNYLPYGIDFSQGPTGRFSNGRNIADFIAERLGFVDSIPPYAGALREQAFTGLNYASGGSGIREDTSQNLGERISLGRQVGNHRSVVLNAGVPLDRLKQCLYTIDTGSNDYINNYYLSTSSLTRRLINPELYAESLIALYRLYLKELYLLGARKVALFGIGRIGCTPLIIARLGGGRPGCVEEVNRASSLFNNKLAALVSELNNGPFGWRATYVDLASGTDALYASAGITVNGQSCCTVNPGGKLCVPNGPVCPDRRIYIFWDNLHTTEAVKEVNANVAFNGNITTPFSIGELVAAE